jgi:hypothetical protein
MGRARIAITVDERANRSKAFAVQDRIAKLHRSRLALECAKLDRAEEQALAEEGFVGESEHGVVGAARE